MVAWLANFDEESDFFCGFVCTVILGSLIVAAGISYDKHQTIKYINHHNCIKQDINNLKSFDGKYKVYSCDNDKVLLVQK